MKDKIYHRPNEIKKELDYLYQNGIQRGVYMGYDALKDYYSIKLGSTTYCMGSPFSGKSEFWFDLLINLSEFYGWKHAIFSPESGGVADIVAELSSKYMRKPFYKNYNGAMTDQEKYRALDWINEHFFIIDPEDKEIDIPKFLETVDEIERDYDVTIQTTMIDPFNELQHDLKQDSGRQDLYIERMLGLIRRNAKIKNRHHCIITHCKDQIPKTEKGITFYPPPTARDYAGGQAFYRKGLGMLAFWRPPAGVDDGTGKDYLDNEVHIIVQKYKPKGTGKRGTAKLFFDIQANRYYEPDKVYGHSVKHYAHKDEFIPA